MAHSPYMQGGGVWYSHSMFPGWCHPAANAAGRRLQWRLEVGWFLLCVLFLLCLKAMCIHIFPDLLIWGRLETCLLFRSLKKCMTCLLCPFRDAHRICWCVHFIPLVLRSTVGRDCCSYAFWVCFLVNSLVMWLTVLTSAVRYDPCIVFVYMYHKYLRWDVCWIVK